MFPKSKRCHLDLKREQEQNQLLLHLKAKPGRSVVHYLNEPVPIVYTASLHSKGPAGSFS